MKIVCSVYKILIKNNYVVLHCFNEEKKFLKIVDKSFKPFFYVLDVEKELNEYNCVFVNKYFLGEKKKVLKIETNFENFEKVKDSLKNHDLSGHDVSFGKLYSSHNGLEYYSLIEFEVEEEDGLFILKNLKNLGVETSQNVAVFDIETYSDKGDVFDYNNPVTMISLITENENKLLVYKKTGLSEEILLKDEKEMIEYFFNYINLNPEKVFIGFNSDLFDFPYLFKRAEKLKIKNVSKHVFKRSFKQKSVDLINSIHFDVYLFYRNVYRQNVKSKSLSLDNLSAEFLGNKKIEIESIKELYDNDIKKLGEYCIHDSVLTLKLFKRIQTLAIEFSKLSGISLFDVPRVGFSVFVENFFIKNFVKENELIPKKPDFITVRKRYSNTHRAAIVLEPVPSLVKNVCQLDFRSLYPSIISAYNISPEKRGLIPKLLKEIVLKREEYKKMKNKKDVVEVYKILANSSYGYYVFSNSRWYGFDEAQEVTKKGREKLTYLKNYFEDKKIKVLYGDTDSVFVKSNKTNVKKLLKKINQKLKEPMLLKLEDHYPKGIFVSKKTSSRGAKKKYAFINDDNKLLIKGFETVRNDWCDFARKSQREILELILSKDFEEKEIIDLIKKKVDEINNDLVNIDELVLKDQIRKRVEDYKSNLPHVLVAKKLIKEGYKVNPGSYVNYLVMEGDGKIGDKSIPVQLLGKNFKIDKNYYINNQLMPVFEEILSVLKIEFFENKTLKPKKNLTNF